MKVPLVRSSLALWVIGSLAFWAAMIVAAGGIARGSLAVDYRSFWGAARASYHLGMAAAYDLAAATAALQQYAPGTSGGPVVAAPAPYPPVFFPLFAPFTWGPPALGFALWTLLNLSLTGAVLHRLLSGLGRRRVGALLGLLFFPVTLSLYAGQPSGLLLFGLYRSYKAMQEGNDVWAGLWLGVLFLKPQYALGLLAALLLQRRWRALTGAVIAGGALGLASLLLAGLPGLLAYRAMLSAVAGFRTAPAGIVPQIMLSWRGLLVNLLPAVGDAEGAFLTLVLSLLTASTLLIFWRGSWDPSGERFDHRLLATLAVTLLCSYHSHIYGATLLLVPGAALLVERGTDRVLRLLLGLGLFVPLPLFAVSHTLTTVAVSYGVLLLALVGVALRRELRQPGLVLAPVEAARIGGATVGELAR